MANIDTLSPVTGSVWKIEKKVGDIVQEGDEIMIMESMKMEIPVTAPAAGKISNINVNESDGVEEDQVVAVIEAAS